MPVFLAQDITHQGIRLYADDVHHVLRVLRLRPGDPVRVVDGKGMLYHCQIKTADQANLELDVVASESGYLELGYQLHLGIAPTKRTDRFEWFLEKATEIGVSEITPLICQRSERQKIRPDRLQKIINTALKQSGRARLPVLHQIQHFKDFIAAARAEQKYIAHCGAGAEQILKPPFTKGSDWIILIGPEGDFSEEELKVARSKDYADLNLGPATYRTETAGVMACHTLSLRYRISE